MNFFSSLKFSYKLLPLTLQFTLNYPIMRKGIQIVQHPFTIYSIFLPPAPSHKTKYLIKYLSTPFLLLLCFVNFLTLVSYLIYIFQLCQYHHCSHSFTLWYVIYQSENHFVISYFKILNDVHVEYN